MARDITTVSKEARTFVPLDWIADPVAEQLTFEYTPLSKRQLAKVADSSSKMDIGTKRRNKKLTRTLGKRLPIVRGKAILDVWHWHILKI